ncbi:MAG: exodeoxyribonuclease VII small subunit [Clostridia bacterium]|nr:exodeoxyribonuclease VII small subunit [Clostridia bacterium]
MNEVTGLKYEEAFAKLEEIVEKMSSASVPLDELITLYEEGMQLAEHCGKLLKGYEARLEKVSQKVLDAEKEALSDIPSDDDEEAPF